jgi:hypothetical protein
LNEENEKKQKKKKKNTGLIDFKALGAAQPGALDRAAGALAEPPVGGGVGG